MLPDIQIGLYSASNIRKQNHFPRELLCPLESRGTESKQPAPSELKAPQVKTNVSQILGCTRLNANSPIGKPALRRQYLPCLGPRQRAHLRIFPRHRLFQPGPTAIVGTSWKRQ